MRGGKKRGREKPTEKTNPLPHRYHGENHKKTPPQFKKKGGGGGEKSGKERTAKSRKTNVGVRPSRKRREGDVCWGKTSPSGMGRH